MRERNWIDEVLDFWFGDLSKEDWWSSAEAVDARIRTRFAGLVDEMSQGIPEAALRGPKAALAAVLVYDQFSRNIFRRTPRAFATDGLAITVARNALDQRFDAELTPEQRGFLYMPFEHSEILTDQERSITLFKELGDKEMIDYAIEHRDIIAKFGRFPHRNAALERESTPAERAFLVEHKGFGQ